jgi:hypothetical protein
MGRIIMRKTDGLRVSLKDSEIEIIDEMEDCCIIKTIIDDYEVEHSFDDIQNAIAMSEAADRGNAFNGIKYSQS